MFKRLAAILIGAAALALTLSGAQAASADEGKASADGSTRWARGLVTATGPDHLTLRVRGGREHVVYVDGATTITDQDGKPLSFGDIKVGDRVLGAASLRDDGKWYALILHVFPPRREYKGVGVVTGLEDDAFHFINRRGRAWEFYVDESTFFTNREGTALSFGDLKTGMRLFVKAELRSDGKWWATEVRLGRRAGAVAPQTLAVRAP